MSLISIRKRRDFNAALRRSRHAFVALGICATLFGGLACPSRAALTVMATKYHPDLMFREFDCYWDGGQYPTLCPTNFAGATVYVYVKNTGPSSATITDATLGATPGAHNLATVIKRSASDTINPNGLNSIYFNWDNPPADILDAGEPVWWKADPTTVPVGGVAQVAVRLRYLPKVATLNLGVVSSAGTVTTNITVDANAPQIQSIAYSEDRRQVFVHWRRNSGGAAPTSVWLDGTNVTALTTTVSDPNLKLAASVINLTNALGHFSFHVYQGIYADGQSATSGQRAWTNKFIYSTYGCFPFGGGYDGPDWVAEASAHGFNNIQMNLGDMGSYMGTSAGQNVMRAHGYGYTILDPGKLNSIDPDMWFLNDEPELVEYNNYKNDNCGTGYRIPCDEKKFPGTLAINEAVEHAADVRSHRPNVPVTVNLDGGLQPQSFYNWGPALDILQTDNYYEPRMRNAYEVDFNKIPLYNNARFSYAIGRTITAAAEPNPGHHLLYSTAKAGWPYPAWQSKRFEVYYTLAGGTRAGIGYWWLIGGYGMNNTDPDSQLLWKEVGLCGTEIKTARDLIIKSTPIDVSITPTPKVWARAVASGTDSMILYVVNDNYLNASDGKCYVTNVANAAVTLTLPAWMQPSPMAFEITAGGLKPVSMTATNGNQMHFALGTLTLTRMIVLTKDPQVPLATQNRYLSQVRPGVCSFASAYCTNSKPVIVVQPQSQIAVLGDNVPFVVTASAVPSPAYQWRFNGTNLAGTTDASYTRGNVLAVDAGGYSVVVSNSLGAVTSVVATLTVSTNGLAPFITTPPQNQTVDEGNNATFTVVADGGQPLNYQWRFNGAILPGATDTNYTRFSVQPGHAGNYTVVVTNLAGAITSAPAVLSVSVLCNPVNLANGAFETTNGTGVATGWTAYEVNGPTIKVWSIQTNLAPAGSKYQQIQAYNADWTANAGVRQDVTGCAIGATYQIAGWYRSNSDFGRARVRVSPSASANWNTAMDLNPVADYGSGVTWATFSGTVVAGAPTMTLWLDGRTISGASGKVGCFDAVTITCVGPTPPPVLEYIRQGNNLVFNWPTNYGNYGLIATTNLGAPWSSATPVPTVVNGTNFVTNTVSGEQRFYRLKRP